MKSLAKCLTGLVLSIGASALAGAVSVEAGGYQTIPAVKANTDIQLNGTSIQTIGALNLFVDGTNGNDTGACTASGQGACLTIQGAVNRIPKVVRHPVSVSIAAGTYAAGASIEGFVFDTSQTTTGAFIKLTGTLANVTPSTGTATGTFASATGNNTGLYGSGNPSTWATATDSTQSWTVNNLAGDLLVLTGGTGSGQVVMIASNTATVITIAGIWPKTTPDATTTYAIQVPSTHINGGQTRATGALGYGQGQSGTFSIASFYIDSNSGGMITSNGSGSIPTSTAFTEPSIVVERIDFNGATNTFGVAGMSQYVGLRANTWTSSYTGFSPIVARNSNLWIEASAFTPAQSNAIFVTYGTVPLGSLGATGYLSTRGNVLLSGAGSSVTFGKVLGARWDCVQNSMTGTTSSGEFVGGSVVYSGGNKFTSMNRPIRASLSTGTVIIPNFITIDGDVFSSNTTAVYLGDGAASDTVNSVVEFAGTAASGSGNTTGVQVSGGGQVVFIAATAVSSTTDLTIDGTNYTLTSLRSASPKAIRNLSMGTLVREH